jgi:hypothetical protein
MKKLATTLAALAAVIILCEASAFAGTVSTSSKAGSHNWSDASGWTGGVPNSSIDAIIVAGSTMNLNGNGAALSLTFNGSGGGANVTIPAGDSLYVFNATTMNAPSGSATSTISVFGKFYTADAGASSITLKGTGTATTQIVFGANGVLYCAKNLIATTSAANIDMTNGGLLIMKGGIFESGTFTAGAGTVDYNIAGINQAVAALTYNNLTFDGDHTKTSVSGATVNGVLTMKGTASVDAAPTYGGSSSLVYASTSAITTGAELISPMEQLVVIDDPAGVTLGASTQFDAGVTMTAGVFNNGSWLLTYGGSATLTYNGASAQSTGNELSLNMPALVVTDNPSGVTMQQSTTFSGGITCSGGNFYTIGNTASLNNTSPLTESDSYSLIGTVTTAVILAQSSNDPFNGIGIEINALGAAPGYTNITRTTGDTISGDGHESITRSFSISASTNSGLDATVVFHYFNHELNGNTAGAMDIDQSLDNEATWNALGGIDDGTNKMITAAGVNALGIVTAIDASTPLAIHVSNFTASAVENSVKLDWSTISETNNYGFYVQRSTTLQGHFADVSKLIPGAGTSLQSHSYSYTDLNVSPGTYYYRLRDQSTTGVNDYSSLIKVVAGVEGVKATATLPRVFAMSQNYPNPFNPTTTIAYQLPKESFVKVTLYNALGQEIRTLVNETEQAGYKSVSFDGSSLASGTYFYRISAGAFTDVKKLVLLK